MSPGSSCVVGETGGREAGGGGHGVRGSTEVKTCRFVEARGKDSGEGYAALLGPAIGDLDA